MRVLLAHNYYRSGQPSGENAAFELERALLERAGHRVAVLSRHSDELIARGVLGTVRGAAATPWNPGSVRAMRRAVAEFTPDVVHVHNTFPLLSPAILYGVGGDVGRVMTIHNYRLFCAAGIPLRDGAPCTDCLRGRSVFPALRHGCYRGSRLATLPLAAGIALHRRLGTWQRHVDAFVALSEFQRELLVEAGLPRDRIYVKPNFYPGRPEATPWLERRDSVVFAGRLSPEKGLFPLVDAWRAWGAGAPELRIAGHGRSRIELEARARGSRITFVGALSAEDVVAEIARARLLVLPSVCFEGFPMVVREAFAFGTPAAVSNVGPLPEIVEDGRTGVVFPPGDAAGLLDVVRKVWNADGALERMSHEARREYEHRYTEAENLSMLTSIYERAREARRVRVTRPSPAGAGR